MSDKEQHGEPTEGLEQYVEEQLAYASDAGEYAAASDELQQVMDEIAALERERAGPSPRSDIEQALAGARSRLSGLRQASGATPSVGTQGPQMDYDTVAPQNEARERVLEDLDPNSDQTEP